MIIYYMWQTQIHIFLDLRRVCIVYSLAHGILQAGQILGLLSTRWKKARPQLKRRRDSEKCLRQFHSRLLRDASWLLEMLLSYTQLHRSLSLRTLMSFVRIFFWGSWGCARVCFILSLWTFSFHPSFPLYLPFMLFWVLMLRRSGILLTYPPILLNKYRWGHSAGSHPPGEWFLPRGDARLPHARRPPLRITLNFESQRWISCHLARLFGTRNSRFGKSLDSQKLFARHLQNLRGLKI